jgi:hypothetical protein
MTSPPLACFAPRCAVLNDGHAFGGAFFVARLLLYRLLGLTNRKG